MTNVLMVAYSCEPNSTSEGAVGWELSTRIARRHHVTLLTRPKARIDIDRIRLGDPSMDLEVEYHELGTLRSLKYVGLPVSNLRYLVWNHRVAQRVLELEKSGRFDVVHHTTWVRHWMPSAAAGSRSLPFIWGPVGAAERTPLGLYKTMGWRGLASEWVRLIGPRVMRLDPLMRRTMRRVTIGVASSPDTSRYLSSRGIDHVLAPSVGYDRERMPRGCRARNEIVSVGRLLDWKGFHLGIRAFAALDEPDLTYVIIGDGPERRRLTRLADELGVGDRVELTGRLDRDQTLERICAGRLLLHPSLHDSGGFVVVEALAQGTPVLSLDIGGPPFLAGSGGIAVSPDPAATLVDRLTMGIVAVLDDSERSESARRRAEEALEWERIVDVYDGVYRRVTGET